MNEQEPFIGAADRPNVELNPDQPIAQLTVRDFNSLLSSTLQAKTAAEFKRLKPEIKELKHEIKEFKIEKFEKFEKFEHKEKLEKIEVDLVFEKRAPDNIPDPRQVLDDPRFKQLIDVVSQLNQTVQSLNERVQRLEQRQ